MSSEHARKDTPFMIRIGAMAVALGLAACAAPAPPPLSAQVQAGPTPARTDPERPGFSIHQSGITILPAMEDGYFTYAIESAHFEIRTAHDEVRLYLAEMDIGPLRRTDRSELSVLSSVLIGATGMDDHTIFIADHTDPLSSNTSLSTRTGLKAISATTKAYPVTNFHYLKDGKEIDLSQFEGVLFAYAWVDLDRDRRISASEISRLKLRIGKR